MNVLITCCLGDYVKTDIDIIRSSYKDVRIIGVDAKDMIINYVGVDDFVKCPMTDDESYVDFLLDVCKKYSIDVLIPTSSLEIAVMFDRLSEFDCAVTIGRGIGTRIANDKSEFCDFSELHRIKIPPTKIIKSVIWINFETPVVVKYPLGKGVRIIKRSEEIEKYPCLIQKVLTGDEYSCICMCKNGEVEFASVSLNKEMDGSTARYAIIVDRPDIIEMCAHACNELKLDGMVGFDLKEDENGEAFILECNPRITATASLTVAAEVNIIKAMIDYFITGRYDFGNKKLEYGTSITRCKTDVFFRGWECKWMKL